MDEEGVEDITDRREMERWSLGVAGAGDVEREMAGCVTAGLLKE